MKAQILKNVYDLPPPLELSKKTSFLASVGFPKNIIRTLAHPSTKINRDAILFLCFPLVFSQYAFSSPIANGTHWVPT